MIKVEVTHLKAPWPDGASVGSVVLLDVDGMPSWAAGKCTLVPDGDEREPVGLWVPASPPGAPELVVNPAGESDRKAADAAALAEALELELDDAEQAIGTARAEIQSLGSQLQQANAEIERLTAAVADAQDQAKSAIARAAHAELANARATAPGPAVTITGDGKDLPQIAEAKAVTKSGKKFSA